MAFIRCFIIAVVSLFGISAMEAQIIYYPEGSSQLLQSTAEDMAMLLQKAMPGSKISAQTYNALPLNGIILLYDSSITDNQACRVQKTPGGSIQFSAAEDNGLHYGIYQYLQQLGFRFYQPGSIWEKTPALLSIYQSIDTIYTCKYTYKNWFITGGHSRWIMDNANDQPWDIYFGDNGHRWALYQRRNGMSGGHRFMGHRGDIMTPDYLSTLQNNICYTACYDGKRIVDQRSVPDIANTASMNLWSDAIADKYTQFKTVVYGKPVVYANLYRNFKYNHEYIGVEVPDGARWANSIDNSGCFDIGVKSASDQHFSLSNFSVEKISGLYPGKRFQVYAYDEHADIPSVPIKSNIDVQVVATGFQNVSSAEGLLNRWYNKTNHVSEYQYMNLTQWSGETPSFYLKDLEATIRRLKEKNSQGITWEASPAKFASLPFLLAANKQLTSNVSIDSSLHEFCNSMFAEASGTVYDLLHLWSDEKIVTISDWVNDNKYKIPRYLSLIQRADEQTHTAAPVVRQRISELKAYLHYLVLYYDWAFDQRSAIAKQAKAAALCTYLAEVNKMQLVNSYFLIMVICNGYTSTDNFYKSYNVTNGTAYNNGKLDLITVEAIETNFKKDKMNFSELAQRYTFEDAGYIRSEFDRNKIVPLEKISVKILYTNGKDYPNTSDFYIHAPAAGNFSVKYSPHFDMPGKGYINFTVESTELVAKILKDYTITHTASGGILNVSLPAAGIYKLTIVSKFKSALDIDITTNGNYFYKNSAFLGTNVENYRPNLLSLPGYFHVPKGISRIYFSINNANPGGMGFATPGDISKAFLFKDNTGKPAEPQLVSSGDSALFYLQVPPGSDDSFWQSFKMEQYRLSFHNISNLLWYAKRISCNNENFTTLVANQNGTCVTQFKTRSASSNIEWELYDAGTTVEYKNRQTVPLPANFSPNTILTLKIDSKCAVIKRLGDDLDYLHQMQLCAIGAPLPAANPKMVIYPNPGTGIFYCAENGNSAIAENITIYMPTGAIAGYFKNTSHFNLTQMPAGVYLYKIILHGAQFRGRLVKL